MFLRLFIAIAVPSEVRAEIGRAQGQLRRDSPPHGIRWTRPEQFHVTLKFLGDVPSDAVAKLEETVGSICRGLSPMQLSARGIGFFPNERKPRVIWVGADDERGDLAELHRQLEVALEWLAPAERPGKFSGHITLGRFKPGQHASPKLMERAESLRARNFGVWQADAVEIVRSELASTGAVHTVMATFPLNAQSKNPASDAVM